MVPVLPRHSWPLALSGTAAKMTGRAGTLLQENCPNCPCPCAAGAVGLGSAPYPEAWAGKPFLCVLSSPAAGMSPWMQSHLCGPGVFVNRAQVMSPLCMGQGEWTGKC